MKQTYKLTKEEYNELQELLSWWRKKKQKKINKKIKAGKGINPMKEVKIPYQSAYYDDKKGKLVLIPYGITTELHD